MENIPTSKAAQAAHILREAIANGEWTGSLPGERILADELMISRSSLRQALDILTNDGVLVPVEQSKRRVIARGYRTKNNENTAKRAVFLTPEPLHRATPLAQQQITLLSHHLSKAGISIKVLSPSVFQHQGVNPDTMQSLLDDYPDAHWILHQCPERIQRWFSAQSVRATVLGSIFQGVDLPHIDQDLRSAARHAAGLLLARGHRRLGFLRFRSHLAGDDYALEGLKEALASHGEGEIPAPVVLSHNFHVARLTMALDKLYSGACPPTALIVLNHHHFITTFSHLLSAGIRIPEQVSIISLTHDPLLECLSPTPVSYKVGDRLILGLAHMIMNPAGNTKDQSAFLIPQMSAGTTVATCSE